MPLLHQPNSNGFLKSHHKRERLDQQTSILLNILFTETFNIIVFAINRLPPNGLLFLYDSYIRKLPHRLLASQVKHGNEKPLLAVHMKRINLIKMLFPSIHPLYISWFYLNQCNFFYELFSQLPFLKKRQKSRRGNCLVLPHASYGPVSSPT